MIAQYTCLALAAVFTNFRPRDITLLRIVAFKNGAFKYSSVHNVYLEHSYIPRKIYSLSNNGSVFMYRNVVHLPVFAVPRRKNSVWWEAFYEFSAQLA